MQAKQYKFVLLGNTDSGKTCIAKRFCESDKPREIKTINSTSKQIKSSYQGEGNFDLNKSPPQAFRNHTKPCGTYSINILDIEGTYKLSAPNAVQRYQPDGIIVVVDSDNDLDFDTDSFCQWLTIAAENSAPATPIYVCLSKVDDASDDCATLVKKITSVCQESFLNGRKKTIAFCSAQQNVGIKELFNRLLQEVDPSLVTKVFIPNEKGKSSQCTQKTSIASTGWYDLIFENYPNWLIGLMVLSLLIEFANLALQIVAFFPAGQFLALGLSFDYAAPTMHSVLWIGISLITWGACGLLKKTITTPSESTVLDNLLARDHQSTSQQTNIAKPNAVVYQPVTSQDKYAEKPKISVDNVPASEECCIS